MLYLGCIILQINKLFVANKMYTTLNFPINHREIKNDHFEKIKSNNNQKRCRE